ncbi:serine/threonine-protein kinase [Polyangium sp. 15x6]|uniref:serine/threonine-protein kinase n=1 Tax=Polyangium sp. 15x6 TaxID=3042687 RepID=UPI00249B3CED|nr:serine/threonine-protein kinase [Polyangium sp. 15x6]MDI3289891.1 protein kinase [Polyangium sp. 15x6]
MPDPDTAEVAPHSLDATLQPGAVRPASPEDGPVHGWDRYQPIRLLGQGGMGRVFLARDLRLSRDVALKFVRGDDPELPRRFVLEARAQARVDHERVCKVYEVGEIDGKIYIAMQYIDGRPLSGLVDELTVEQKAMLVRGAALGVHEAHKAGLIHRDLKPSNIMVERTEEGELRPYVMDFGLARSSHEGASETGTIRGTPHYMSPEQASGEASKLDRRSDVYSLGATLHALLTGAPPIPGDHPLEVLSNIAHVEPRRPRDIDPRIPADIEAIVLKCLEKDRSDRYDSARAFAEDLERFLDGEPVLARRAGPLYRLRKRARKHRRLVAAAAVALVAVLVALGWGIHTRREASERERLARRYTALAEHIEAMARYSALAPLHDVRADRERIRASMAELEAEVRDAGPSMAGPGYYALGRGFLALDDDTTARHYLLLSWQHDDHEPRVAYALALVHGRLYQRGLLDAERIHNAEQREEKRREVERRHRDPAITFLARSEGAEVPSTAYVAALLAFYEGRNDDALSRLDALGDGLPWFYEAPLLRGDVLLGRALERRREGRLELMRADLEASRRAYAAAAAVGESVPAVHAALGELEYAALVIELYGGGDVDPPFERGVAAADRALRAAPDHAPSLLLEARLRRSLAEYRNNQGRDIEPLLADGIRFAERAAFSPTGGPDAELEIARGYRQWGEHLQSKNVDPRRKLAKALEISNEIRPDAHDYDFHVHVGLIHKIWADYEDQVGLPADLHRGQAIDAYRRAIDLDPRGSDVWLNLAINAFARASQPGAADPEGDLREALAALERGRAKNPQHIVPYFYGGEIHALLAKRKEGRGEDPGPLLGQALATYRAGLTVNPRLPHLHNGVGAVLVEQARVASARGLDPVPLLAEAERAFEQAILVAPDQGYAYSNKGFALVRRAMAERARGENPEPSVRAAVDALEQALERIPGEADFWSNLGMAHAVLAEYESSRGRDPTSTLRRAFSALEEAIARNPRAAQAHVFLGEARSTEARSAARKGRARPGDFDRAARHFQRGLELEPKNAEYLDAFRRFCGAWAAWLDANGEDPGPARALLETRAAAGR